MVTSKVDVGQGKRGNNPVNSLSLSPHARGSRDTPGHLLLQKLEMYVHLLCCMASSMNRQDEPNPLL